ncbi:MAG TPA: P1 family peptidase [Pyrinomonadaceae bacterium]
MFRLNATALALLLLMTPFQQTNTEQPRPRARDIGLRVGVLPPGRLDAITDVGGVRVGHATLIRGEDVRTGVTAVLPHGGNLFREKVPAAVFVGNGFGKLMGSTQVEELGEIETPILLTNTLGVPRAADALVEWVLALPGNEEVRSVNPLVAETNDGQLNDIRGRHVGREEVFAALKNAGGGEVEEGSVGAGTGTVAFGFKGGIGTASRVVPQKYGGYTVGVLVQTNYGGVLTMNGAPVGRELGRYYLKDDLEPARESAHKGAQPGNEDVRSVNPLVAETNDGQLNDIRGRHVGREEVFAALKGAKGGEVEEGSVGAGTGTVAFGFKGGIGTASRVVPARFGGYTVGVLVQTNFGGVLTMNGAPVGRELGRYYLKEDLEPAAGSLRGGLPPDEDRADGSVIVVVATDAPLDARNLRRLAARAMLGLARTGSPSTNGSGDYCIAFSTAPRNRVRHGDTALRRVELLPNDAMSPLFLACVEATEEAVYNSLLRATPVTGRGGARVEALPIEKTVEILKKYRAVRGGP